MSITKRSLLIDLKKNKVQTAKTQLKWVFVFEGAFELLILYDFNEISSYKK